MDKIDVDRILQEVRESIQEKGIDEKILSFDEIAKPQYVLSEITDGTVDDSEYMGCEPFSSDRLNEICFDLHSEYRISPDSLLVQSAGIKGKAVSVIKKAVHRCLIPVVDQQNEFNETVVRAINMISKPVAESSKEKERINYLEKQTMILMERVKQLEKERGHS